MAAQKRTDVDWEALKTFAFLAEHGSLSAAARGLKVTHVTVSRRLEKLELWFGQPLFERRDGAYRLTAAGSGLEAQVAAMREASYAIGGLAATSEGGRQPVRISVPRTMADRFLIPHLAQVALKHEISVATDSRVVSIPRRETDISVRLGRPDDTDVVGIKLGSIHYRLYGTAAAPEDVFIGYLAEDEGREARWLEAHAEGRAFALRTNSQSGQLLGAEAGLGVALLPSFIVAAGSPLQVVSAAAPTSREVWLLAARHTLRQQPVRETFDAIAALFAASWPA